MTIHLERTFDFLRAGPSLDHLGLKDFCGISLKKGTTEVNPPPAACFERPGP